MDTWHKDIQKMSAAHGCQTYSLSLKTLTFTHSAYGHAALRHSENVHTSMTLSIKPVGITQSDLDTQHKVIQKMEKHIDTQLKDTQKLYNDNPHKAPQNKDAANGHSAYGDSSYGHSI